MTAHVQIRRALPRDFDALGEVFHEAVREGATGYSEAQRAAWSPAPRIAADWSALLDGQIIWIGELCHRALGFITLDPGGHVDLAYIRPEAQGTGLFRRLYSELEAEARARRLTRLWTEASLHAKGPFEAMGFKVLALEDVTRGGEVFRRFRMERRLDD